MLLKAAVPERQEERFVTELKVLLDDGYGVLRNVSASGVYFETAVALREGQQVRFALEFAHFPSGPISVNCIARIVRVEERGAMNGVAAEISSFEFRRISEAGKSSGHKE
jgi:hypothetical protein